MPGVIWEYELDKEWVRRHLDAHARGWEGTDEALERIMWAIFEFVGGEIEDFVKEIVPDFLYLHASELGLPSDDD